MEEIDVVDALAQLSFLVQGMLADAAGRYDLSPVQARLLGVLRDRTPTMNQLASLLELDKSSVTGLVSRAEARGLVARRPSETDGRSTIVAVTPAGRRLIRLVSTRFSTDIHGIVDVLSPAQIRTLQALATRMIRGHAERESIDLGAGQV